MSSNGRTGLRRAETEKTMKAIKELAALKTDKERWAYLLEKKDPFLLVLLDNDMTFVVDSETTEDEESVDFDTYVGWSDGVQILLDAAGIANERV